jgi:hypothetical protein
MPRPTLVTIQQECFQIEALKTEHENRVKEGKPLSAFEQIKFDIRMKSKQERLRKMMICHDMLTRGPPRISILVAFDKVFRDYLIRYHLADEQRTLAQAEEDEYSYGASLSRRRLQRIEFIAQAFAELDAEEEHSTDFRDEDPDFEGPFSFGEEYLDYRALMAKTYPDRPVYRPAIPEDVVEEIMNFQGS